MSVDRLPAESLPLAVESRIDDLCSEFEAAWSRGTPPEIDATLQAARDLGSGEANPAPWLRRLLVELIAIDLEYRWRKSNAAAVASPAPFPARPKLEDYLAAWPLLGVAVDLPLDLIQQEYRVRRLAGEQPRPDEYAARFPLGPVVRKAIDSVDRRLNQRGQFSPALEIGAASHSAPAASAELAVRCPHCHDAVSVVADSTLASIACQSCGRVFSIVDDSDTEATPPTRIAHFDLLEKLGAGGFGAVWKARDTRLDRIVAIKVPRKGQLNSTEAQQFLREARAAAQLKHPNIVSVHEVGRDGDLIYIVSDYVAGETLATRLESGPLPQRDAAELTAIVADALEYAHSAGVVHRDLKPANIMLDADGHPHVMDFGLAKREFGEATLTIEGRILGTPAYMSPEQARGQGHQADRRSDVYSLGAILFELLTGQPPFAGNTQMLLLQILNEPAPSPRHRNRSIARDLETICLKCLEKLPSQRYGTAGEVAAELRRFLRGEPILARPISGWERSWRWCRARPLVASLSALLTLMILATAIVAPFVAARQARLRADAEDLADDLERSLETQKQLTRAAHVLRLAAQAKGMTSETPRRAMLLAAEAVDSNLRRGEPVAPSAHQALRDVLMAVGDHEVLAAARSPLTRVALGGDDRWLAVGAIDGSVQLFDLQSAKPHRSVRELQPAATGAKAEQPVYAVAISRDGHWLSTANDDGSLRLFDLRTPESNPIVLHRGTQRMTLAQFSPDSRYLVAGGADRVPRLYDLSSKEIVGGGRDLDRVNGTLRAAAFSPDGTRLAIVGDARSGWLWRLKDGSVDGNPIALDGHNGPVLAVAFSPDGKLLATGGQDATLRLWKTDGPELTAPLAAADHKGGITSLAFSPDGKWLATASVDRTVRAWDLRSGANAPLPSRVLAGHESIVRAVAFSPTGRWLASAGEDKPIRLWDFSTGEPRPTATILRGHEDRVHAVAFTTDERRLFSVSQDKTLNQWSLNGLATAATPIVLRTNQPVRSIAISGDGRWLAAGSQRGGQLWLWELKELKSDAPPKYDVAAHGGPIGALAFAPDHHRLATAGDDGTVMVWNTQANDWQKSPVVLTAHQAPRGKVAAIAFDPTGRLATAGWDGNGTLRVWPASIESSSKPDVVQRDLTPLLGVASHPREPLFVTASEKGLLQLWSRAGGNGTADRSMALDNKLLLTCLAISPDALHIYTGDHEGRVKRWDLSLRHRDPDELGKHDLAVSSLAVSADGRWLATSGYDHTLRLWDITSTKARSASIVIRSTAHRINSVAITPDSRYLVTGGNDGTIRLWPLRMNDLVSHARRVAGRELTTAERFEFQVESSGGR